MTALILQTVPLIEIAAAKFCALGARLRDALDTFAESRIRNAVPVRHLRRAEREYTRCRKLMRPGRKLQLRSRRRQG